VDCAITLKNRDVEEELGQRLKIVSVFDVIYQKMVASTGLDIRSGSKMKLTRCQHEDRREAKS
jgi:hypothetical protein